MSDAFPPDTIAALRAGLAGRYTIERELGAGGMAVVYLAHDLQHDRLVALKVLRPELAVVAGVQRFHREIRLAARLVHPHILPLLNSGDTGGHLWYTMPFIDGESLRDRLDREKVLPLEDAIRLTREVADALARAHAKDILHRDIKPENILLADDHALVADFGIASALGDAGERLTGTGVAIGTPAYMSPEQWSGSGELDARSDLYALASVCYEMLVGEPPPIRTTRASIPEAVDTVVRRALAPMPADRFASVAEFSQALVAAAASGARAAPSIHKRWPLIVGAAALAIAAVGYQLATRSSETAPPVTSTSSVRLAVVPFRFISGDTSDLYLAAGLTDEVQSTLSNLSGLRVIATSSVAPYAVRGKTAREIGSALAADALVEGDVQRAGSAVRVRVRLVDPHTEELKWSQEFDHTARDVFRFQSEVAGKIAGVLRIQLAERESRSLSRPSTTNPEAYDLYLRGLTVGAPSNAERSALDTAIARMTRAVELDSSFALARATLASYEVASVFLFDGDPRQLEVAGTNIRRALGTDSTLAIAWKARSDLAWNAVGGWRFPESLSDLRRALALQPSSIAAHNGLGSLYFHYGFLTEARGELEASLSLDPRDGCGDLARCVGFSRPRVARVLWYGQQFDSALDVYRGLPSLGAFDWEKAVVLNALGRAREGLAVLDSADVRVGRLNADREAARALLYASLRRSKEALAHIAAAVVRPDSRSHFHHAQFTIACAYARLGRKSDAVSWLRRAAENGMPNYPLFRSDPNLQSLQGDAEYEAFMRALKQQFEAYGRLVGAAPP